MCAKVTLTKNLGIKTRYIRNYNALPILTLELWRKKKHKKYDKYQFCTKDFQRIHHFRFRKGIMKSRCPIKKAVLKHFAIFTENSYVGVFFNKVD